MADDNEDAEEIFGGLYENGHWVWDEKAGSLQFVSDLPPKPVEVITMSQKAPTGAIEFRDDVDLIEQIRYRRRYQRKLKPGQPDVVTLQDVKDLAIYTAPVNILSPMLINLLHTPTTERFLRALILCCAYYFQVSEEMSFRMLELESKVRTPNCDLIEKEFRENISDLRILVAKEYALMLIGGADTKKYHHMGPHKKLRSLSDKDAKLYETLLRMSVQIVWLALGRKSFNQIELETSRIFRSEVFNNVEHNLKTGYIAKMSPEEQSVLLGHCVHRRDKKLYTQSPLMNEMFCKTRPVDYRLLGLGVVKYPHMSSRLQYLYLIVASSEEKLVEADLTIGIIGLPRNNFDTLLRPIPHGSEAKSKSSVMSSHSGYSAPASRASVKKSEKGLANMPLYPPIVIPRRDTTEPVFPTSFPEDSVKPRTVSEVQRKKWLKRLAKLMNPLAYSQ